MTVRERGDGDRHFAPRAETLGARKTRNLVRAKRLALHLHSVNQLHQFAGAPEVAERELVLGDALRRVPTQRKEARHSGVEKLPDQT
jgi:hypothetical protein